MLRTLLIIAALTLTRSDRAHAQLITVEELTVTSSIFDMSPDGRFIVGANAFGGGTYLMDRWTGALTLLPMEGNASAVSDDGTIVVGSMENPDGVSQPVAGRWTAATGWVSLGTLPGAMGTCGGLSSAREISGDGSVIVGSSNIDGCQSRGFRWTEATGMVEMDVLGNANCGASVVSADGALLGGSCQGVSRGTPSIWTADGTGALLDPPDGETPGRVWGISDDGTKLLGEWNFKPFILDEVTGLEVFGNVIPAWAGAATDIADDGTVIGFDRQLQTGIAWIRRPGGTTLNLRVYLESLGVKNVPPSLERPEAISADGRIIVGRTVFNFGWIINLCVPDLDGSGAVDFGDILRILADWDERISPADLDGSGAVGFGDLLEALSGWGECP